MKRDFELIRKLLLELEGENIDLTPYTDDIVLYHKAYLCEARLAEGTLHYPSTKHTNIPDMVFLKKLTPEGHDLIDSIQDEKKWNKVKSWIKETGKAISLKLIILALTHMPTDS